MYLSDHEIFPLKTAAQREEFQTSENKSHYSPLLGIVVERADDLQKFVSTAKLVVVEKRQNEVIYVQIICNAYIGTISKEDERRHELMEVFLNWTLENDEKDEWRRLFDSPMKIYRGVSGTHMSENQEWCCAWKCVACMNQARDNEAKKIMIVGMKRCLFYMNDLKWWAYN